MIFLAHLGQPSTTEENEDDDDDDHELDEDPISRLNSFSEAMKSLDDAKLFLESRGCIQESIAVGSTMNRVAAAHLHCYRISARLL